MPDFIPLKAYARQRGCSPAAVRKAVERLDIPRDSAGRVDAATADRLWHREPGEPGGEPGGNLVHPHEVVTFAEAKRRRELAKAQREELALAVAQGTFGPVEYFEDQLLGSLTRVRQVLLNLPGKIAPQLVGVGTVARAQLILQQAIDEVMPTLQAIGEDPTLDA